MKPTITTILFLFSILVLFGQNLSQNIISYDIDNFWTAYDKIITTKDSLKKYDYINKLFIEKGSAGLKAIMQVRDCMVNWKNQSIRRMQLFI